MRLPIQVFKGLAPITAPTKLPEGWATDCFNTNLVSGDLDSFIDIGNPYKLAKPAPINTIWLLKTISSQFWFQFEQSEVAYGSNIDLTLGAIPGDSQYRTFITGLSGGPQQTTEFYATDPSQQGSSLLYGYPYKLLLLGTPSPIDPPSVNQPAAPTGITTPFEYAQPVYVNSLQVNAAGSNYKIGDVLSVPVGTGTLVLGLPGAQVKVTAVDPTTGAIQTVSMYAGGFYTVGPSTSGNLTGGSGAGATYNNLILQTNTSYQTWQPTPYDNTAGSYGHFSADGTQWVVSSGQGDTYIWYSTAAFNLGTATTWSMSVDMFSQDNGDPASPDEVVQFCGTYNGHTPSGKLNGPGVVVSRTDQTFVLYSNLSGTNGGTVSGTVVNKVTGLSLSYSTYYRISISAVASTSGTQTGFTITATIATQAAPGSIIATVTGFVVSTGASMAAGSNHRGPHNDQNTLHLQNIYIQSTQPASATTSETLSYVTTYDNSLSQESGPSDPSATITVYLNEDTDPPVFGPVPVTILPSPGGQDVQIVNLYRLALQSDGVTEVYELDNIFAALTMTAVAGTFNPGDIVTGATSLNTGTVMSYGGGVLLLDNVTGVFTVGENISNPGPTGSGTYSASALSTTTIIYSDSVLDENLGVPLPSADWAPPPSNLQGIISIPNGITAGFFLNTLCLTPVNIPWAWPVGNQYTTDTPIVAIAPTAETVLILTTGHPYTAWGSDPSAFTMVKETANQGCVSKRSVCTHKRLGIVYASGNGLCYYRGQGELDLIRLPNGDPYFSIEQWQAIVPSSINAVVHDDRYWFCYDTGSKKGAYCLDLSPAGFGLIELDVHWTAAYVDPSTDTLYFCLDQSEFAVDGYPISSAQNIVNQWEGGTGLRARTWTRQDNLYPRDVTFQLCQVDAEDYSDLTLMVASETGTAYNDVVTSPLPFVIAPQPGRRWVISFSGTSRVNRAQLCESSLELMPG